MIFFVFAVNCYKYHLKVCKSENNYSKSANSPWFPEEGEQVKFEFTITPPEDTLNIRSLLSENIENYAYELNDVTKLPSIFFYKNLNHQWFEIIPADFKKCYRIVHDDDCLSNLDGAGKSIFTPCNFKDEKQLFEFVCVDCPPENTGNSFSDSLANGYSTQSSNFSSMFGASSSSSQSRSMSAYNKVGRLDRSAFFKIREIEKMVGDYSTCFTVNGTCNEHANEMIPLACFNEYDDVHNINKYNSRDDLLHHLDNYLKDKPDVGLSNKIGSNGNNDKPPEISPNNNDDMDQDEDLRLQDNRRRQNKAMDKDKKDSGLSMIKRAIKNAVKAVKDRNFLDKVKAAAKDAKGKVINKIKDGLQKGQDKAKEMLQKVGETGKEIKDKLAMGARLGGGAAGKLFQKAAGKMNEKKAEIQKNLSQLAASAADKIRNVKAKTSSLLAKGLGKIGSLKDRLMGGFKGGLKGRLKGGLAGGLKGGLAGGLKGGIKGGIQGSLTGGMQGSRTSMNESGLKEKLMSGLKAGLSIKSGAKGLNLKDLKKKVKLPKIKVKIKKGDSTSSSSSDD